ncbi:MAG: moderate conductance mechanosensitive channel [Methanolobus sp.]|jgi:small-conductance mechanosensitive channel|uniref:Small-conductance mechanosensitive channel n=1 Tax=Methanolobus tindarius DSM 2278 TaxID=1090322 RepID=W9DST0_METTI|nr:MULTISPECIES: mechanosensitive ion channel domain-containing protein [Methanolobus]ETA68858.1 small-conductance mechanosensitive channel [Methanolobus tindarius DSM 2278]MDI3486234.1 moderate conductance mechanosensitive channel [Methanolobus sp.]MDK2830488.1 moderate conductance mechanosensitive channel [Methanolobus sp.]MDK2938161.1 moderate conductance mechanosensitive channel [Methanolobus sp.]
MAESNIELLIENFQGIDFTSILLSVAIFFIAFLITKIVASLLSYISEKIWRHRLHLKTIIPIIKVFIYLFAIYYILTAVFAFSVSQVMILMALLGAAIGLALRDYLADLAAGFVIVMEKPYQVGDRIEIGEYYGEVTDIGLRSTRLVTPYDNTVSAPNNLIFTECVASGNAGSSEMMAELNVYINNNSDADLAIKILREAVVTSRFVYISSSRPVIMLLNDHPFYKIITAKAYVNDLRDEFVYRSDVTRRAWNEFHKAGIKAPELNILGYENRDLKLNNRRVHRDSN